MKNNILYVFPAHVVTSENSTVPSATLNGDGVYLSTIYTLLLNLKLIGCGYYQSEEKSLPISEVIYYNSSPS